MKTILVIAGILLGLSVSAQYCGINVDSVRIDSITNLPCGLCWSTNKPSLTFAANERGCINFAGTSTDVAGTYSLGLYGTAYTPMGAFGGSLNAFWGNFYVFVKQPTAACTHGVGTLLGACGGHAACTFVPQVVQISPASPCTSASAITVGTASPYAAQMWYLSNDTGTTRLSPGLIIRIPSSICWLQTQPAVQESYPYS